MSAPEESSPAPTPTRAPPCTSHPGRPSSDTCRGCGLFLCEECAGPEERCGGCRGAGHPIPWEDPSAPRLRAFGRTLRALVRQDFFDRAPWTGGLRAPVAFAVVCATLGAAVSWGMAWVSLAASDPQSVQALLEPVVANLQGPQAKLLERLPEVLHELQASWVRSQGVFVLLTPVTAALEVLVLAALSHPIARALGGQGSFEGSLRVTAYSNGAAVLHVLPGMGGLLALLARVLLATLGMRRAHGISTGRALVTATWWIPVAVVLFLAAAAFVLHTAWSAL